jgi:hypothetical protein
MIDPVIFALPARPARPALPAPPVRPALPTVSCLASKPSKLSKPPRRIFLQRIERLSGSRYVLTGDTYLPRLRIKNAHGVWLRKTRKWLMPTFQDANHLFKQERQEEPNDSAQVVQQTQIPTAFPTESDYVLFLLQLVDECNAEILLKQERTRLNKSQNKNKMTSLVLQKVKREGERGRKSMRKSRVKTRKAFASDEYG